MNEKIVAKIKTIDELREIISDYKRSGRKVVQCHGVFDLLHLGHIRHFGAASKFGDILIVTVTPDQYVNKGPHKPVFTEKLRAEAIAALNMVDYVAINKWPTAAEIIRFLKPCIYVKGIEYKFKSDKRFLEESKAIEEVKGEMKFTSDVTYSSSNLINQQIYRKEVICYLEKFKDKYNINDINAYLKSVRNLKVLVIGEIIVEEYCSGLNLGKMRRESIAEFMVDRKEKYLGGSGIIVNYLSAFIDKVDILTLLGDKNLQEDFINSQLDSAVEKYFFTKKNSPTPVKTRYIEEIVGFRNLFKVTEMNDQMIDKETSNNIIKTLDRILPKYDLVIVADYGHGMIDNNVIEKIISGSAYLAVSTQINTENRGYNTIDKYPKLDYGCINEEELRLISKDKYSDIHELVSRFMLNSKINKMAITMGFHGCLMYSKKEGFYDIPALSVDAVDTIGASDVFFGLTSAFARINTPLEIVGFIGNVIGALCIKRIGDKKLVSEDELLQYIEGLMK